MISLPPELPREELDFQLSPSRTAKDFMGILQRNQRDTETLQQTPGVSLLRDVAYGVGDRQRMDICHPEERMAGASLVFIHGGFWQEGSKAGSGFASAPWVAAGFGHVSLGYTLSPEVRLRQIVGEVAAAVVHLHSHGADYGIDPNRLVLVGHSAGAHLVAAMVAGMGGMAAAQSVRAAVLISGVFELAPIAASYVNDAVGMDAAEIADLSPLRAKPLRDIPVQILIGADESQAFQWQSDMLYQVWQPHLSRLELHRAPGRDHFDILDELMDLDSATGRFIRETAER